MGLTQAELAARLGVSQTTISRWEDGSLTPSRRTLLALQQVQAEEAKKDQAA